MSDTMAHLQYMPGDPRLVDQLVYELKSKGIFDQFRKECIADVDTRPAYQNLRQRVESSVASFLARQTWKPDLNKNQLREKLRKHLLDGNYLEQGVERIVDQVVNPKVASVFIPQVEDLVYNYLGIPRRKTNAESTSTSEKEDLLPTDLEAVSPASVKSNEDKEMEVAEEKMEVEEAKEDSIMYVEDVKMDQETRLSGISELTINDDISMDKSSIPLPTEEIKLENIPAPENSPPNIKKENIDLEKINLPREPNLSTDIPLPDEILKTEKDNYFKHSEDDNSVSDSDCSLRRNMSPLTPIRNFNNENSCDAQQGFENEADDKSQAQNEPSTFRFTIEAKSSEDSANETKIDKKDTSSTGQNMPFYFSNQTDTTFNTPLYDESSNSNNLHIDYESDVNSKATGDMKVPETENSVDLKKDKKDEKKSSSHKSSHKSRDSHRSSSSKDKKDHKSSRDSSRHDKKTKDKDSKSHKDKAETEKKDSKDSKHRSSSSHKSSHKDSKHRSSSSSKHSSSKDDKKSSSSSKDKTEKSSRDKDRSSNSRSSSHRSDKDKKSEKSKPSDEKENRDKKKEKKDTDDHYSVSGRGNHHRRSTDRDSNDGSSSSKGSQNHTAKSSDGKKGSKTTSKSTTSNTTSDSPSDRDNVVTETNQAKGQIQSKPVIRVDHLDTSSKPPKRLPFVPDVTMKKPRFASNMEEAKQKMKMRKFFEEEQKRMNQEAALLLEFQANVRPSLSQVYSSIPGPELEFACISNTVQSTAQVVAVPSSTNVVMVPPTSEVLVVKNKPETVEPETEQSKVVTETNLVKNTNEYTKDNEISKDCIAETLIAMHREKTKDEDITMAESLEEQNNKTVLKTLSGANQGTVESEGISDNISRKQIIPEEHNSRDEIETPTIQKDTKVNNLEIKSTSEMTEEIGIKNTINFEVTIIGEELSDNEEYVLEIDENSIDNEANVINSDNDVNEKNVVQEIEKLVVKKDEDDLPDDEIPLEYFAEHEKYKSELETNTFDKFLKSFIKQVSTRKMYLINCDTYEENLIKDAARSFGKYEVVTYHKNGHVKMSKSDTKIIKNVNVTKEVTLPTKSYTNSSSNSPMFSPKSEHSFELSSDYDAKLEEMVNNTSRKQIMEIIFGGAVDETPSEMPQIGYCFESNIENVENRQTVKTEVKEEKHMVEIKEGEQTKQGEKECSSKNPEKKLQDKNNVDADDFDIEEAIKVNKIDKDSCRIERDRIVNEQKDSLKRKLEIESSNNNRPILSAKKLRRGSDSHKITSTTGEDTEQVKVPTRSKYIGKAKWVGLPKPKKAAVPNPSSPSSDKSVENYEQLNNTKKCEQPNTKKCEQPNKMKPPNGKLRATPRAKVQRYDTADLYKPKLHYLSRRNNVT